MLLRDYYKILNVPPIATLRDIKDAYRRLSKKYHPDINPSSGSEEKMKEIVEAFEILKNTSKRKKYDSSPQFQFRAPNLDEKTQKKIVRQAKKKKRQKRYKQEESIIDKFLSIFTKDKHSKKKGLDPEKAQEHFTLAYSMSANPAMLEHTIIEFKKVVEYDPKNVDAHYNLGLCYYKKGKFKEAVEEFKYITEVLKVPDKMAQKMIDLLRDD